MNYLLHFLNYNRLRPYNVTCLYVLRADHVTFDRATHWCAPPFRQTTFSLPVIYIYLFIYLVTCRLMLGWSSCSLQEAVLG